MKIDEIKQRIVYHKREIATWEEIVSKKSCNDCVNQNGNNGCKLADGMVPPPEVQNVGCDAWEWDEIPF